MSNDTVKHIEDHMRPLRLRYLTQLQTELDTFEMFYKRFQDETAKADDVQNLKARAHKLAGTGKMYGFPQISEKARTLEENLIEQLPAKSQNIAVPLRSLMDACESACKVAPDEIQSGEELKRENIAPTNSLEGLPLLLIVDDDPYVCDIIVRLFGEYAQVIVNSSAAEALSTMKTKKPALVLLDDQMPGGKSGLELLEEMREDLELSTIQVIMLTASNSAPQVVRGLRSGVIDYITKPFDLQLLEKRVCTRLEHQKTTILIADDDENVRELLLHKFRFVGINAIEAEDGFQALEEMKVHKPNLVLLDWMMPGMNGAVVLKQMQMTPELRTIPVIFLTAKSHEGNVREGLRLGASDYITKPFDHEEVLARCTRLLNANKKV